MNKKDVILTVMSGENIIFKRRMKYLPDFNFDDIDMLEVVNIISKSVNDGYESNKVCYNCIVSLKVLDNTKIESETTDMLTHTEKKFKLKQVVLEIKRRPESHDHRIDILKILPELSDYLKIKTKEINTKPITRIEKYRIKSKKMQEQITKEYNENEILSNELLKMCKK